LAVLENVVLVLVPTAEMAIKQTMIISANMTAYSTAVGPSSDERNRRNEFSDFIFVLLFAREFPETREIPCDVRSSLK
jgi:hypothetical protein